MTERCWANFTALVIRLSRDCAHEPALFSKILKALREESGATGVLYVREDMRDDHGRFFVAGDELPGRNFRETECERIHPALRTLLKGVLPDGHLMNYEQIHLPPSNAMALVFTVCFAGIGSRLFLALFGDPNHPFPTPDELERERAYDALTVLAHLHSSLDFSQAANRRDLEREALQQIMEVRADDVAGVAKKLCQTWGDLLSAKMVRLWVYNSELEALDLLSEVYPPEDEPLVARLSSRLPIDSFGGKALRCEEVRGSAAPLWEKDWKPMDQAAPQVFAKWPHLLCVPLILPKGQSGVAGQPTNTKSPTHYGVLDIHLEDTGGRSQPDRRLMFLGKLTASALDLAHLIVRRYAMLKLNELGRELIIENIGDSLRMARDKYLDALKNLIREAMHANCVSIFEFNEDLKVLQCIASTGIEGQPNLDEVRYPKNGGATWKVFEKNLEFYLKSDIRADPDYRGLHKEARSIKPRLDLDPFLAATLPGRDGQSIGVIRVQERRCHCHTGELQNFSFFDADLLKMIAAQVSPIIQMLRFATRLQSLGSRIEHQLIQPIQGALGYTENLVARVYGSMPPGVEQKLHYVHSMLDRAAKLIRSGEWGRRQPNDRPNRVGGAPRKPVRLSRFLLERNIDIREMGKSSGVTVSLTNRSELDDIFFQIDGDEHFAEAVGNILHNAMKYAYPRTSVDVKADKDHTRLLVDVMSVGLPIAPNERERIFEDRRRGLLAVKHDNIYRGSGQGLYIARKYLRDLGGDLVLVDSVVVPESEVPPRPGYPPAARTTFRLILAGAFPE